MVEQIGCVLRVMRRALNANARWHSVRTDGVGMSLATNNWVVENGYDCSGEIKRVIIIYRITHDVRRLIIGPLLRTIELNLFSFFIHMCLL